MSRKKSPRGGKGASAASSSSSPSSALPAAQQQQQQQPPPAREAKARGAAGGRGGAEAGAANGVAALPGRPSLSSSGEFYDVAFKVMLVGDSGVGKTCLLVRFKDGAFLAGSFISTVGIDFRVECKVHTHADVDVGC
ncbi:UNVERIFIED_CONTAM: hypothetical protein K2H54_007978 [Gekko kuhli]